LQGIDAPKILQNSQLASCVIISSVSVALKGKESRESEGVKSANFNSLLKQILRQCFGYA